MDYTWDIIEYSTRDQVNSDGVTLSNAVVKVRWKKTGTTLGGVSANYIGLSHLTAENTAEGDFVSVDDITKATLINWVKASISETEETIINNVLQKKVDAQAETVRTI